MSHRSHALLRLASVLVVAALASAVDNMQSTTTFILDEAHATDRLYFGSAVVQENCNEVRCPGDLPVNKGTRVICSGSLATCCCEAGPSTLLTSPAKAGDKTIDVASFNFELGQEVTIDGGALTEEDNEIESARSTLTQSYLLARPLQHEHDVGATIRKKAYSKKSQAYAIGQLVERRDKGERWGVGYVTSIDPLKVTIFNDPHAAGHAWDEVRPWSQASGSSLRQEKAFRPQNHSTTSLPPVSHRLDGHRDRVNRSNVSGWRNGVASVSLNQTNTTLMMNATLMTEALRRKAKRNASVLAIFSVGALAFFFVMRSGGECSLSNFRIEARQPKARKPAPVELDGPFYGTYDIHSDTEQASTLMQRGGGSYAPPSV